jgi:hypothetical protein
MSCVDTESAAPTIPAAPTPTITPDEGATRPIFDSSPMRSDFYHDRAMRLGFVDMSVAELVEDIKYFQIELRNLADGDYCSQFGNNIKKKFKEN